MLHRIFTKTIADEIENCIFEHICKKSTDQVYLTKIRDIAYLEKSNRALIKQIENKKISAMQLVKMKNT
eukprot:UN19742